MQTANPFIVCVEGRAPLQFKQSGDYLEAFLDKPGQIGNICIMLSQEIPNDKALCLYYSVEPFNNVEFLTAVANMRPTDIIPTNFPLKPSVKNQNQIKIIVRGEAIIKAQEMASIRDSFDLQKEYAKKVALNLYNYMLSFEKRTVYDQGQQQEFLIIPTNIFEKWHARFLKKYELDNNFILNTKVNLEKMAEYTEFSPVASPLNNPIVNNFTGASGNLINARQTENGPIPSTLFINRRRNVLTTQKSLQVEAPQAMRNKLEQSLGQGGIKPVQRRGNLLRMTDSSGHGLGNLGNLNRRGQRNKLTIETSFSKNANDVKKALKDVTKPILSLRNNRQNVHKALNTLPLSAKNQKVRFQGVSRRLIQPSDNIRLLTNLIKGKKRETISGVKIVKDKQLIRKRQKDRITKTVKDGFGIDKDLRTEWLASKTDDTNWNTIQKSAQKCYIRWKATQPRSQSVDYSTRKNRYSHMFEKEDRKSLHSTSDTTPKHLRYKRKIKQRNLLDDRIVRDVLMPKFEILGLGKVLKRKVLELKFQATLKKVRDIHKKRTFYIPKTAFNKRKGRMNLLQGFSPDKMLEKIKEHQESSDRNKSANKLNSQKSFSLKYETSKQRKKREQEELNKTHFKITYKDCIIPDDIFETPEYQNMKRTLYVKNLPKIVAEFYRRKKQPRSQKMMIATWLGTIRHFEDMTPKFLEKIVMRINMVQINNKYLFFKDKPLSSLYILIKGQIRLLKDDKSNPLIRAIHVLNPSLLYAISSIPSEFSTFVIGDAMLLELKLEDILQVKRSLKK